MTFVRQTLADSLAFEGRGLHSGVDVMVTLHPGTEGIWFRIGSERILARPENVADTRRCTRLGRISTIEHLMAALGGLEITDLEVEVTAPELPALDGSAKPYVDALRGQPLAPLGDVEAPPLFARLFRQSEGAKLAISSGEGHWRYEYRAESWPFFQVFGTEKVLFDFPDEIAPARTFAHASQVESIRAAGLAQGLDLDSALILGEEGYQNAARFPDEPARHKLLDAMGDLYLAAIPLRFLNVVAQKSGHRMNVEAAAALREAISPR